MIKTEVSEEVYSDGDKKLYTINLKPGQKVYGEQLVEADGKEFRSWHPKRSKPAAAIKNNIEQFPLHTDSKVLYLGAGSGTTASHFSDIARDGLIYTVEISSKPMRDLIHLAESRDNLIPLKLDARKTDELTQFVFSVDLVYMDLSQADQSSILIKNSERFLKTNGYAMIALKARSISSTEEPEQVFAQELDKLSQKFKIIDKTRLEPYEKDHLFVVLKKRDNSH